ncbi:hemerythrin domain-containing protein [Formosa algae]|uniref:hemerythrin domain-containing protein n=1 Tax=Formosa algae TaxID=225843 RepID=UPI000CCF5C72|nr:hemerythrin domain-containing protein [Formosa algae]PNW29741.1 cation-binding protein [Formosa algae]
MTIRKPLKRHKALQPLSREHHQGLLLSWKIRTGFKKKIQPERMKVYTDWFYKMHLVPHFSMEETHIFPLLGADHTLCQQAILEHKRLGSLFANQSNLDENLTEIANTLEQHIRFEERTLFPEIQKVATEAQMKQIENIHDETDFQDNISDEFWK